MNTIGNEGKPIIISYIVLRQAIGWLGVLLPFILLIGNYLISWLTNYETGCNPFKSSISDYYYTLMGEVFVGTLCAVALFLFCYIGYEKIDSRLCNIAGFFAFGIVFFPTSSDFQDPCNMRCYISSSIIGNIHLTMAAFFFITLAYISYFIFTMSKGKKSPQKIKRNKIYKCCAIVMVGCIVFLALYVLWLRKKFPFLEELHFVFSFEALALVAFGFSWLIKGEFLLKDNYKQVTQIKR